MYPCLSSKRDLFLFASLQNDEKTSIIRIEKVLPQSAVHLQVNILKNSRLSLQTAGGYSFLVK